MRYLSVCSGIEAATVAWHPLGWEAAAYSEIEAFPRAVLAHHYTETPLHGDFTTIGAGEYGPIDLLVGGTPCQSFSVAGLRGGLADDRGNLALEFLRLADRTRARWVVWENVPGVLSSNGGRDFGAILGGLVELGYGFAYRVLDAQHFGVPQRRRRVFVVGCLGDWRRASAVLFERHSLSGHPAPRRGSIEDLAGTFKSNSGGGGWSNSVDHAAAGYMVPDIAKPLGAHALSKGRGTDLDNTTYIPFDTTQITSAANYSNPKPGDPCHPLARGMHPPAVAFQSSQSGIREVEAHATLDANNGSRRHNGVIAGSAVRRLTPRECERLQGFPDDYTFIPYRVKQAADGPRYKALGNSMAVPVMRWIGERIAKVEALQVLKEAA